MPWRNWSDDEELFLDVRDALHPDPIEAQVIEAARAVRAWQTADPDRELAALLYDSYVDQTVGVRGPQPSAARNLVFGRDELRVEIELSGAGIEGQLIPPEPATVRLFTVAGLAAETTADEVGCFTFPATSPGPIRIECSVAGRQVATEWISV
ncbi:hypothetical protein EV385_0228 [Krasilnikovia cinnamomea]|uniref:Uncharacterized protein n=1 Tax=Krasilnikovia cinnamomea TaxID=349313 RepID=A0A4Q7ZE55_9ACTN|nr:carboxypeptidase-like regulatory domain-containing protein [Krasilnikovia cinnamomea]RZU48511.1 hypothetical protein EV385_0228 [Krasilnikovia cinnamomea]